MNRPWMGLVALLNIETTDGRIVENVMWEGLPLPLVSARACKPIGTISDLRVEGGVVLASGWIVIDDIMLDRYAVGVDLVDTVVCEPEPRGLTVVRIKESTLRAVTMYDNGSIPAWPECHIRILR